ncbi:probable cytochrome P450 6a23 [Halyomorpha halys]|uniref:probable cytochrome P450 6a23 n=1 Tax=Halyomorpha halys TaxID=286706 RepID=UPI0006D4E289
MLEDLKMLTVCLIILALTLVAFIINRVRKIYLFWEERGIKHNKPLYLFGNTLQVLLNKKSISSIFEDLCKTYPNEPLLGHYDFLKPSLIVQDADYIEKVLIKDFVHFTDHGFEVNEEKNPIDSQLFTMCGKKWRAFRYKLSPIFTSGKLKNMFDSMSVFGDKLVHLISMKKEYKKVHLRELMTSLSMDIIASTVFGIEPNVLENPDSEFRKMGKKVFSFGILGFIKMWISMSFPWLAKKFGLSMSNKEVIQYFTDIIKNTFSYRRKNNIQRNDFVQMMIQLQDKGHIEVQNWDTNDDYLKTDEPKIMDVESYEITENVVIAQAFTFLTTGLDTIGIGQTYLFYDLALYPDIQDFVREEIIEQCRIHGGLNYNSLKAMTYLENCVKESQRLHSLPQLFRLCNTNYTFPNGYTIKKGEALQIPVSAIHKNPDYYPDPEVFKPERYDNIMRPGTWLPFGEGPRVCIAMRFALLQIKFGVARLLMKYRLRINPQTKIPVEYLPQSVLLEPKYPIYFDLEELS